MTKNVSSLPIFDKSLPDQTWGQLQVHLKVKYKYFENLLSTSTSTPVKNQKVLKYIYIPTINKYLASTTT